MDQTELTVISTLAGVLIGGLFAFLTTLISNRSEERSALREVLIRVASEQHLHQVDKATEGTAPNLVQPFRVYLFDVLVVSRLIGKRWLTPARALRILKRGDEITKAIMKESYDDYRARRGG